MTELLIILIPMFLIDLFDPGLLALVVFAAATDKPVANPLALLAGHLVAYFVAGILLAQGVDQLVEAVLYEFTHPTNVDFTIGAIIGVACVVWALKPNKTRSDGPTMPAWELTPVRCFAIGAITRSVGIPLALPSFAAISQILKANLTLTESLTVLGIYNVAYVLPFAVVPVMIAMMGDRAKPVLERFSDRIVGFGMRAVPWFVFLLGAWLIFDAAYYWVVGTPII